jgi:hypothetical protein
VIRCRSGCRCELAAELVAIGRVPGQRLGHDRIKHRKRIVLACAEMRRRFLQMAQHDRDLAAGIRRSAGQALMKATSERVDVGAAVDVLAPQLLGRLTTSPVGPESGFRCGGTPTLRSDQLLYATYAPTVGFV